MRNKETKRFKNKRNALFFSFTKMFFFKSDVLQIYLCVLKDH